MKLFLSQELTKIILLGEKYAKTDLRYLAKGGFWLLLGQGTVFLLSLFLVWVFANVVDKETYGQYRFLTAFSALLALLALPGANVSLVKSIAQGFTGSIKSVLRERINWSFIGTLIGLAAAGYYFVNGNSELAILFIFIGLANPFVSSFTLYSPYLNGLKNFRGYALTHITQRVIVTIPLVCSLLLTKDIVVIMITYLGATIVAHISLYLYVLSAHPPNDQVDSEAVPYARHLSFLSALREGSNYIDKLLLWYLTGPVQVATYAIAMALPQEIYSGLARIGLLALPKMANRNEIELRENLLHKVKVFAICTVPLVAAYYFVTPVIFKAFFPQYLEAYPLAQLAGLLMLTVPTILFIQYFNATKNTRPLFMVQVVEPIVFMIGLLVFVPPLGPLGAIIAVLIKVFVAMTMYLFFFISVKLN